MDPVSQGNQKKWHSCVLQRTCILKPRDICCFVVFRSIGPYFDRFVALLEVLELMPCRQGQELLLMDESYKCE